MTARPPGDGRQIELSAAARADRPAGRVFEMGPDIAYRRVVLANVMFVGRRGDWVLVDTGLGGMAALIVEAAAERFGRRDRPKAIVMTHAHADHAGAVVRLARGWDIPVYAHRQEAPYLDGTRSYPPADTAAGGGLMTLSASLFPRRPVDIHERLVLLPGDGSVPPMPGWQWLHTPGHTPGHVSFWREADRTLIAGDAFVTTRQEALSSVVTQAPEMHGPPRYFTSDWPAAKRSVALLAELAPERAITGHGRAMGGRLLRQALNQLAERFDQVATPP